MHETNLEENPLSAPHFPFEIYGQSCYAALKSFASGLFRAENAPLFYAYFSLYSHYDLLHLPDNTDFQIGQPFDPHMVDDYVLTRKLGLKSDILPVQDRLASTVQQALQDHALVLVPVNKGQFLSRQPGQDLYPYPLLITAYDQASKSYLAYDDARNHPSRGNEAQSLYIPVTLDEKHLEEAFRAPMNGFEFPHNTVQVIRRGEGSTPVSLEEALKDCVKQLTPYHSHVGSLLFRKLQCLCLEEPTASEEIYLARIRNQLRYINSQKIFSVLLRHFFSLQEKEWGNEIYHAHLQAWQAWKTLLTLLNVGTFRKGKGRSSLAQLISRIRFHEKLFLETLTRIALEVFPENPVEE